jgi:hypothetical protein
MILVTSLTGFFNTFLQWFSKEVSTVQCCGSMTFWNGNLKRSYKMTKYNSRNQGFSYFLLFAGRIRIQNTDCVGVLLVGLLCYRTFMGCLISKYLNIFGDF